MVEKNSNNENKYLVGKTLLYVDEFGAIGDGVHDDAVAIRSCCEAAAKLHSPARLMLWNTVFMLCCNYCAIVC